MMSRSKVIVCWVVLCGLRKQEAVKLECGCGRFGV